MKTGSCFCGNLRYEFSGEPVMSAICHCLTCQKLSGTTYTTNICIPEANYRATAGTPKTYNHTHESGMKMVFSFCGDCGVTVSKIGDHEAFKGLVLVQAGSLDGGDGVEEAVPAAELYVKDRVSWVSAVDGSGQIREIPEAEPKL